MVIRQVLCLVLHLAVAVVFILQNCQMSKQHAQTASEGQVSKKLDGKKRNANGFIRFDTVPIVLCAGDTNLFVLLFQFGIFLKLLPFHSLLDHGPEPSRLEIGRPNADERVNSELANLCAHTKSRERSKMQNRLNVITINRAIKQTICCHNNQKLRQFQTNEISIYTTLRREIKGQRTRWLVIGMLTS